MGEKQKSIKIHLETSGVNTISGIYDWITLSPKRHSPPKNYFLEHCDEIKIIINDEKDLEFAKEIRKEILKRFQISSVADNFNKREKIYFLQPAWENEKGLSLAIDFVKNNPAWNLSIQTHKYLKIK